MTTASLFAIGLFGTVLVGLMIGYPVAFTLAGISLLFALVGAFAGVFDLVLLQVFPAQIFDIMSSQMLVAVPLFLFMGFVLERSKIAEDLLQSMGQINVRIRGGMLLPIVLVGTLLAASTGIVGASVTTLAIVALPTLLKRGVPASVAGGTIAACGTLGQIIPPSIVLIFLGDQLSVAYQNAQFEMGVFAPETITINEIFAGALLPGLLLALFYCLYLICFGPRPIDLSQNETSQRVNSPPFLALLSPILLIIGVLGSILFGLASTAEAAAIGAAGSVLLAAHKQDQKAKHAVWLCLISGVVFVILGFAVQNSGPFEGALSAALISDILKILSGGLFLISFGWLLWRLDRAHSGDEETLLGSVLNSTLVLTAMIFSIVIAAKLFALVFRGFGGDELVEMLLAGMPGGTGAAIFFVMLTIFLMGFFLDFLEITFIIVPLVAPVLLQMPFADGSLMSPIWLAVLIGLNLQTSFLTPPFGFALFYLRGAASDLISVAQIYRGVIPFIGLQLACLILVWFAPALATWLPEFLY